jgi:selenocysteine lyase/cysteine desulfurase
VLKARIENITYHFFGNLESYFSEFRANTIGMNQYFVTPYGRKKIIYADWTASGRLYSPIEAKMTNEFGPFVGNTHTEANVTGTTMTRSYKYAQQLIKKFVHANDRDFIIMDGSGMTSVVNKLQRLLGLRAPENLKGMLNLREEDRPVIFVTHMEHHSNQISWAETIGDVIILEPKPNGTINIEQLEHYLQQYRSRKLKIGSFTACTNVTGIQTPYYRLARKMHEHGGICFIDFSASAPYVEINMHPKSPLEKLDGIFFSPHKFLGGPGTSGVLIMDSRLYRNRIPDHPGGGTVSWTNPWGELQYLTDFEAREDGGTPGFLQGIKTALCFQLKELMGVKKMLRREKEMVELLFNGLKAIPRLHILDGHVKERIGIISFYVEDIHYNLIVKLLNDRFGIQVRGGCSCAGTYGHYLLHIDRKTSKQITDKIDQGDLGAKPGWVRLSIHPIMANEEINYILFAIQSIIKHIDDWKKDYHYDPSTNDFLHLKGDQAINIKELFEF